MSLFGKGTGQAVMPLAMIRMPLFENPFGGLVGLAGLVILAVLGVFRGLVIFVGFGARTPVWIPGDRLPTPTALPPTRPSATSTVVSVAALAVRVNFRTNVTTTLAPFLSRLLYSKRWAQALEPDLRAVGGELLADSVLAGAGGSGLGAEPPAEDAEAADVLVEVPSG